MTYIYYANGHTEAGKILHHMLQSAFKKSWMKRCRTLGELTKRLHDPLYNISAAVLLIDDRKEFGEILSLKDILWDIKLITIISSHADISQANVEVLRPRFLTWTDTDADSSNVVDILGNIMKCEPGRKVATAAFRESNSAKKGREGGKQQSTSPLIVHNPDSCQKVQDLNGNPLRLERTTFHEP
jgi:hypothetical protein